mgnify:FL=1
MNPHNLSRRAILTKAAALGTVASMPVKAKSPEGGADAELLRLAAHALTAWAAYEALANEWSVVVCIPEEIYAEQVRLYNAADELRQKAMCLPARTFPGLRAKARLTHTALGVRNDGTLRPGDEDFEAWSLCQDLLMEDA